jgi:transketolase
MLTENEINELKSYCKENRRNIIEMVYLAQSGHIGGSLSSCEILTVLYHKIMNHVLKWQDSKDFDSRDRFVLSKGHVSPLLYSVMAQIGYFDKKELKTFRKLGTRLQGHPAPFLPGVEIATGSLGQGLSFACGIAMSLKLDNNPAKVYVLLGDGEMQEGNIWEALMQAPHRKLNNLIAIVDRNRLQIDGNTEDVMALGDISQKLKAFGWEVIEMTTDAIYGTQIIDLTPYLVNGFTTYEYFNYCRINPHTIVINFGGITGDLSSPRYMAENLPFIARNQRPLAVLASTSKQGDSAITSLCWIPYDTNKIMLGYGGSNVPYYGQMIVID